MRQSVLEPRKKRVRQVKHRREVPFVYASYLQLSDRVSPHMMAHHIIHSDIHEEISETENSTQKQFCSPSMDYENLATLQKTNKFYADIDAMAQDISPNAFLSCISRLSLIQAAKLSRLFGQITLIGASAENRLAASAVARILSVLRSYRDPPVLPMLSPPEQIHQYVSKKKALLRYFRSFVMEFEDRVNPRDSNDKLTGFSHPDVQIGGNAPASRRTVSYILEKTALQKDVFSSFVFNSKYKSVMNGSESGGQTDEEHAWEAEMWQYFYVTAPIPDLQVKLLCLKKSYALLKSPPYPEFNRFPQYLCYTIQLLYESKGAKKMLNVMKTHYEVAAPVIAVAIKTAIDKIENEMLKWMGRLSTRNNIIASLPNIGCGKKALNHAKACLSLATPTVLQMTASENHVYQFLRAFCSVVHTDIPQMKIFFDILDNLAEEVLVMRPFAGALLMIPKIVEIFEMLEKQHEDSMLDEMSLRARDKFTLRMAERAVLYDENVADAFIHGDAPRTMRMFFEYAVTIAQKKRDTAPQKLTFATYIGNVLMREIETFCDTVRSLQTNGDLNALYNLYLDKLRFGNAIRYVDEAVMIVQGRQLCGIARRKDGSITVRCVSTSKLFPLTSHYAFSFVHNKGSYKDDTEKDDTPDE